MSTYVAPVKDMLFAMNELAGFGEVVKLPGCEELSPDLAETILDEAGKFAGEVLAPLNTAGDRQGAKLVNGAVTSSPGFKAAYQQFVDNGWTTLSCPTDFGGQGMPYSLSVAVNEMWKSSNLAFSLCPMLTQGAIEAIAHHAVGELKTTYLPKMVSGEWTGTMNLTEPQAGSDLAAVRTRAVPEGDHYRLTGTKIFITWGEHDYTDNIIHAVLARLPDAPEGVKGISLFLVPKYLVNADGSLGARNDVQCVSLEHKLGIHGSPTAVLAYGEKGGAIGYLIGEPNRGLEYMFTMMNHARLAVGLEGVAIGERAYQKALSYARERVQGRPLGSKDPAATIIGHPDVRRMLMTMKAETEAMRALAYYAYACLDHATRNPDAARRQTAQAMVDLLTPVVKGWLTETGIEVATLGIQVHGGMGFIEETGAAQFLRDARITTIYEGTTGIQALDLVGRKVGRDGGAAVKQLLTMMGGVLNDASHTSGDDIAAIAAQLKAALALAESTSTYVAKNFGSATREVAAGSVPYLMLMGIVGGGWQMLRAALAAQKRLAADGSDEFAKSKIITARFYADHLLPRCGGYAHEVLHGAASALRLDAAGF
jgi:alkylation response protein AidB-like acyl-CoA dehydrogenase